MTQMANSPEVKLAVVGVSRDCFPIELTRARMERLVDACERGGVPVKPCKTVIETESDALAALSETLEMRATAAVIYLGNFGPEGPLSVFARVFPGPVMVCAAAEENKDSLVEGRGDALCGLLSASYNLGLRGATAYIPPRPVALPEELAGSIAHFQDVARVVLGSGSLKVITFGPRPQDFFTCHAPLKPLYELGMEVMENSELDLLGLFEEVAADDSEVKATVAEMADELGEGSTYPDLLPKLARFEVALKRFATGNLGSKQFVVMANKCWPAFERAFGFVPCYVNGRLAGQGMPVACEVDIYGAVSEYMCQLATRQPATLLDLNNSAPSDVIPQGTDLMGAELGDLFMGFHCGNTPSSCMVNFSLKYQLIMKRLMEPEKEAADITRGTLEGRLRPGPTTFFRLQGTTDGRLTSYIAQGNILDVDTHSFGGVGVFAIPNFARFYRHALLGKQFPHHGAVAFDHCGRALFDAMKLLGVEDISVPLPPTMLYPGENPFEPDP